MASQEYIERAITVLGEVYSKAITGPMIVMWCKALSDIPEQELEAAIQAHIETGQWFPVPAVLREKAAELALKRAGFPLAMEAWQEMSRGPRPNNPHPLAVEAFKLIGGWHAFGRSPVDQEASWRARFIETYNALLDRYKHDTLLLSPATREAAGLLNSGPTQNDAQQAMSELLSGMRASND